MQEISEHFALLFRRQKSLSYRFFTASINFFRIFRTYACRLLSLQHFLLVSRLQNTHMDKGFVGKDHIRGNFFLSGDLQAKSTELLKKGLILFSQITDCRFRKSAPFSLFSSAPALLAFSL